eukprot:544996-Rhodomonas_salina.4
MRRNKRKYLSAVLGIPTCPVTVGIPTLSHPQSLPVWPSLVPLRQPEGSTTCITGMMMLSRVCPCHLRLQQLNHHDDASAPATRVVMSATALTHTRVTREEAGRITLLINC